MDEEHKQFITNLCWIGVVTQGVLLLLFVLSSNIIWDGVTIFVLSFFLIIFTGILLLAKFQWKWIEKKLFSDDDLDDDL